MSKKRIELHVRARRNFSRIKHSVKENIEEVSEWIWNSTNRVSGKMPVWLFSRNDFIPSLCKFPAVYVFLSNEGDILYVGKAKNVSKRVGDHLEYVSDQNIFMDYVGSIILIRFEEYEDHKMLDLEEMLIKEFKPIFNTAGNESLINIALIKRNILSKYPSHRDSVIKNIIFRHRELVEGKTYTKELTKYSEHTTVEAVLDELSILVGEYDVTPKRIREESTK